MGARRMEDVSRAQADELLGVISRFRRRLGWEDALTGGSDKLDVDKSYVRCMKVLLSGNGYPMLATHDPRMIAIGTSIAGDCGRAKGSYEFQMLFGIRPEEQKRLVADGESMRVYVPYGSEWYGYLMRRLAERPQNLSFFVKSLISKK